MPNRQADQDRPVILDGEELRWIESPPLPNRSDTLVFGIATITENVSYDLLMVSSGNAASPALPTARRVNHRRFKT